MGQGYREYSCVYPKPGWTDQDVNMLMEANFQALADVLKASGVNPEDVAGMGLSTQRALHLYVDKQGKVLRNGMGISWQDGRHTEQLAWMRDQLPESRYFKITGLPVLMASSCGSCCGLLLNSAGILSMVVTPSSPSCCTCL